MFWGFNKLFRIVDCKVPLATLFTMNVAVFEISLKILFLAFTRAAPFVGPSSFYGDGRWASMSSFRRPQHEDGYHLVDLELHVGSWVRMPMILWPRVGLVLSE